MTGGPREHVDARLGRYGYIYPALGEPRPAGGALVLLLTAGGVCVTGTWASDGRYLGWCPLPSRVQYAYPALERTPASIAGSGELLLLTAGGVCVFGPWADDGRYQGWSKKPLLDRVKEDALHAILALAAALGPDSTAGKRARGTGPAHANAPTPALQEA